MAAPRGTKPSRAGKGRPLGALNKTTRDVREAVSEIARSNVDNVQKWLDRIARKQPARALQLYLDLIEYHIPKLSRAELTGDGGKPIEVSIVRYSPPEPVGSAPVPDQNVDRS